MCTGIFPSKQSHIHDLKGENMYHEEKIINGVLCWRGDPNGEWTPFTPEQLTAKMTEVRKENINAATTSDSSGKEFLTETLPVSVGEQLNEEAG